MGTVLSLKKERGLKRQNTHSLVMPSSKFEDCQGSGSVKGRSCVLLSSKLDSAVCRLEMST